MTITEVVSAFGAYYLSHGQNQSNIHTQMKRGFVTDQVFTQVITDDTIWRASEARQTRIVQPFQKAFTPVGAATFKPVEIRQYNIKADLSETPDDIEASWLGFLASKEVKRSEWPFIRYWMEKLVIPQIQEDIELNEIGRGVYAAPTPGTAGAAGTAMNGILKIIETHITASRITPIALGALPADDDDLVTYFEDYWDAVPIQYRNIPMTTYVPEYLVIRYMRGYEKKYGLLTNINTNQTGVTNIRFSNWNIVGLPSLNLKANGDVNDRFFTTPKSNAIMLTKGFDKSKGIFDIQGFERVVKLLTNWWMGLGFVIPELVWVNDGDVD